MLLSSIFSFDSLSTVKPGFPKTLVVVLFAFGIVEICCRQLPDRLIDDPTEIKGYLAWMDEHITQHYSDPKIIILGSSRSVCGIVPALVEDELGLPWRSCANLSIPSGYPGICWEYYQRHKNKLKAAKLVLLVVDEWHFNGRTGPSLAEGSSMIMRAEHCLSQSKRFVRKEMFSPKFFTFRKKIPQYSFDIQVSLGLQPAPEIRYMVDSHQQTWFRPYDDQRKDLSDEDIRGVIESYYENFCIDTFTRMEPVRQLSKAVKDSGGKFVLLQMPNRAKYHSEVLRTKGQEFRTHVSAVRALASELDVPFYFFEFPSECAIDDESYHDGIHLRTSGAWHFTDFLVRFLSDQKVFEEVGLQ